MESFDANMSFTDSENIERVEDFTSSLGQTALPSDHVHSFIDDRAFDGSFWFNSHQDIVPNSFFGQSHGVSYGISFHLSVSYVPAYILCRIL